MAWSVRVVQRSSDVTYRSDALPFREARSVRELVTAYKLGMPLDASEAMRILKQEKAVNGTLGDEGVVLLAAAMRWGADRDAVAALHPGAGWLENFSNRLRRLPDSGMGHTFVLRDGRVAYAEDQALACAAAEAMAELAVGLVEINDSWHRRQWTQQQARQYNRIAKQLRRDFSESFRHADGTYAEALDSLGNVVVANSDPHAWWAVNGIAADGKGTDVNTALSRLIRGDGRDAHAAQSVLRLLHDLRIEPCAPDEHVYFNGRLPHGVRRVVVDGLTVGHADYRLSVEESRLGRHVHLDASRGWATLRAHDTAPVKMVTKPLELDAPVIERSLVPEPRFGSDATVSL